MNTILIKSEPPKCEYCGKEMKSWGLYATSHSHTECFVEKHSERIVQAFREIIENLKIEKHQKRSQIRQANGEKIGVLPRVSPVSQQTERT